MRIWIDATGPASSLPFFHVTLLEHLLRSLVAADRQSDGLREATKLLRSLPEARRALEALIETRVQATHVQVELAPDSKLDELVPASLAAELGVTWSRGSESAPQRLRRVLVEAAGEPVLALSADSVVDVRVIERLLWREGPAAFVDASAEGAGVAARFDGPLPDAVFASLSDDGLDAVVRAAIAQGALLETNAAEFETWIRKLRRDLPPYVHRITGAASARRAERAVFWSNYKGSTDFLTSHVYPPLVWWALGPLTRHRVHPNTVTLASIVLALAAVPVFATGHWWLGLAMAFTMSVLDSVDGKLARVTFTSSKKGDVLDHGLDLIHPPLWYLAWAWGLAGGVASDPIVGAAWWLFGIYVFDRFLERLFTAATGKMIHGYAPIDVRMRAFVSRRNVNLVLFAAGLALGVPRAAFHAVVAWAVASALFHVVRTVQCWSAERVRSTELADPRE